MTEARTGIRIAGDVGGTFTDLVMVRERTGESSMAKVRSTPPDLADGFIHFSTAAQMKVTAAKHFAGHGNLMLLALDEERVGDAEAMLSPPRAGAPPAGLSRDRWR